MVIEWAIISGVVVPKLKKFAQERAEKLASQYADGSLSKLYRRMIPDEKQVAANQLFTSRFSEELDRSTALPTIVGEAYTRSLAEFLANAAVQDLIQAPLDGESELNWGVLDGIWNEFSSREPERFTALPADFDWASLSRLYKRGLQRQMLTSPELRPLLQAVAQIKSAEAAERTASAAERIAGPLRTMDLQRYATALKRAYGYLKFGSIDSEWTSYENTIRLQNIFIPQSVKQALPPTELTRDYLNILKNENRDRGVILDSEYLAQQLNRYASASARAVMEVVADANCPLIVILGDPGLGKSTLLKYLAVSWAESPSGPLTLIVELRRASRQAGYESFLDYLESGANQICCLPKITLHEYLEKNDSIILFDALDEVPDGPRAETVSDILKFADDYPRARIIVTTRVQGYHPGSPYPEQFRDAQFLQFTLQDFDEAQRELFIRRWHVEAFRDAQEGGRFQARLQNAISDSPAIRELAANPLLLTMMAVLSRNQDLPRDRSRLYERCAELLLKNWDLEKFPELRERTAARDIKDKLGSDQKMRILEQVAWAMQSERTGVQGNLISEDKLRYIVQNELTQLDIPQAWAAADDLIWMLRERNFMLSYVGDRQYAFVHRTFLEYFCARNLKYRLERTFDLGVNDLRDVFRKRFMRDEWKEVLRLLCGMIGVPYVEQCLSELVSDGRSSEGTTQEDDPESAKSPGQRVDAILFAAECLQEIREVGLIRKLRQRIWHLLIDLTTKHSSQAESAIRLLVRGWRDDPPTLDLLKSLALELDDLEFRQCALRALADTLKSSLDLVSAFQDGAEERHGLLRYMVVRELIKYRSYDARTLAFLRDSAAADPDIDVRHIAKQALINVPREVGQAIP